jgi:hypothetical protein
MRVSALIVASLLACGCATTLDSDSAAAERALHLAGGDDWNRDAADSLPPGLDHEIVSSTLPSVQDAAASSSSTVSESPHSFSGGLGVRVRDGESALDLVAEYHYRVSAALEVGGIADWAGSPIDSLLIAPAAWLHPNDNLTLFGAPGVEFISGRGGEAALRLGGSYLIPFGRLAIRPFGWYDFVQDRQNSFALGVAIGV